MFCNWNYGMMGNWFFGGMGFIFMLVFWGLVIWLIYALIKTAAGGNMGSKNAEEKALNILKERYAKGELTKEEFEEKKKDLIK